MGNVSTWHTRGYLTRWNSYLADAAIDDNVVDRLRRTFKPQKKWNSGWHKWIKRCCRPTNRTIPTPETAWMLAMASRRYGAMDWNSGPFALFIAGHYSQFIELYVEVRGRIREERLLELLFQLNIHHPETLRAWSLTDLELKTFETAWKSIKGKQSMTEADGLLVAAQAVAKRYGLGTREQQISVVSFLVMWLRRPI